MNIASLSYKEIENLLDCDGLSFHIGPFVVNIKSTIPAVAKNVSSLYSEYSLATDDFADFHISIEPSRGIHKYWHPQANFVFDGFIPFKPLPYEQSFALFEWGLNWCIASYMHQYLILHSAVVEKNGCLVILPGSPGAGKSTLCTALVKSGWRLFSDEMALIDPSNLDVIPVPRPISLKNESIEIIANKFPDTEFGLLADDTHKGRITHVKPDENSLFRSNESSKPSWIIFPKYIAQSSLQTNSIEKADSFMKVVEQCFNYHVLGAEGFDILTSLIDSIDSMTLEYSSLDEAIDFFSELAG